MTSLMLLIALKQLEILLFRVANDFQIRYLPVIKFSYMRWQAPIVPVCYCYKINLIPVNLYILAIIARIVNHWFTLVIYILYATIIIVIREICKYPNGLN